MRTGQHREREPAAICQIALFRKRSRCGPSLLSRSLIVLGLSIGTVDLQADVFSYIDSDGVAVKTDGRAVAEADGRIAIQSTDGRIRVIPSGTLRDRTPGENSPALSAAEFAEKLTGEFDHGRFDAYVDENYVIGVALMAPLPRRKKGQLRKFQKRIAKLMKNLDRSFTQYAESVGWEIGAAEFPLCVVIFEGDDEFDNYALATTGNVLPPSGAITGYYSPLTNIVTLRMTECELSETPARTFLQQQLFNRGLLKRLAPIPVWFVEGFASGFAVEKERVLVTPLKVHPRHAQQGIASPSVDWSQFVASDTPLYRERLSGPIHSHAWGLHWLLANHYRDAYAELVESAAQLEPFADDSAEGRTAEFERVVGTPAASLQQEFPQHLQAAMKRSRIPPTAESPQGRSRLTSHLGQVELEAISRGGVFEARGRLRCLSAFRNLAFHITMETDSGTYAEWHIPELKPGQTVPLRPAQATEHMKNGTDQKPTSFRVNIRSVPSDSSQAKAWNSGVLPVPIFKPVMSEMQ